MDEKLVKSLTSLIDETIAEIEDLKKSRFSAAEIKLDGPGENGIAGKPANGDIGKDDDEDDEDEDEDKKKKEEAEKAEKDDKKKKEDEEAKKADKSECAKGVNEEEDEAKKADDEKKDDKKKKDEDEDDEDEKSKGFPFKKSLEEQESLMKSYVDQKIGGLEKKLADILEVINKIGEQPVSKKGISSIVPLKKSNDEVAPLAKAEVANKLFELKKSGTYVDSADIAAVETGGDLQVITSKYNLK